MKIMNKKVFVASLLIVSTIIAAFAALSFIAKAQPTTLSIEPPTQTVTVGSSFAVDVKVTDISNLDAFDVIILYNSAMVTAVSVIQGPFVPPGDPFNFDLSVAGQVHFWDLPWNGIVNSGSGVIATIKFSCISAGTTPLTINTGSQLFDPVGNPIPYTPINGQVIQNYPTATTYIEPATYTVPICVPFTVNVKVNGMVNLHSFSLVLTYSNTPVVDCTDIVPGDFLPSPIVTHKLIDDAAGRIEFDVTAGVAWGTSGSGTIAKITFHCTGAGESILTVAQALYWDPAGNPIPTTVMGGRVIQKAYWEPVKLQNIVEWPGVIGYVDVPFVPPGSPVGYHEVKAEIEAKGYKFDPATGTAMEVTGSIEESTFSGTVTSWWSNNTLADGTRACLLSAEMDDGTSMAMAFVTNLLPPEQVPGVDPYIIVNAMPYMFVRFYWYAWPSIVYPLGRIITFPYWWYDSHSHSNWFWGPYWWWRCYTKAYYIGMPWPPVDINWAYWRPWWGWWWNWLYWRHWYWWSSGFPYDP